MEVYYANGLSMVIVVDAITSQTVQNKFDHYCTTTKYANNDTS